jgi:tRNA(fMet)-specific endonuclease VapC
MWMLDTDTCSYLLREHPQQVLARLDAVARDEVALSTVVSAELRYGAARVKSRKLTVTIERWLALFVVVPWDDEAARAYARIRAAVEAKGKPIGNLDLLIAAHALSRGATLVTNNTRHFSQVPGLRIENWV